MYQKCILLPCNVHTLNIFPTLPQTTHYYYGTVKIPVSGFDVSYNPLARKKSQSTYLSQCI